MSTVNSSCDSGVSAGRLARRQFHLRFLVALTAGCSGAFAAGQHWGWVGAGISMILLAEAIIVWRARNRANAAVHLAVISTVVLLVGLVLLPATTCRCVDGSPRTLCASQLRCVALAFQMYHDDHGTYPPAYTVDEQGNRLHSWRSLILPYLEYSHLHEDIRFDEPWDSEHNSRFHNTRISYFDCRSDPKAEFTDTSYVVIVGSQTLFHGIESVSFDEVTDGVTDTIAVVEAVNSGIHWMEPRDLHITQMATVINPKTSQGISSGHPGGANVVFADFSTSFLSNNTPADRLRAYLTIGGGEAVERD